MDIFFFSKLSATPDQIIFIMETPFITNMLVCFWNYGDLKGVTAEWTSTAIFKSYNQKRNVAYLLKSKKPLYWYGVGNRVSGIVIAL